MSDNEDETVVLVTPTIEDGTVVRWYVHEAAAENCCEYMSASRNGVLVKTYLHKVPEGQLLAAQAAYELMRRDRNADVSDMATHRFKRFMGREIEPIVRERVSVRLTPCGCGPEHARDCPMGLGV